MVEVTEKLSDVMRSTDVKDEQDEQAQIERSHAKHRSDALSHRTGPSRPGVVVGRVSLFVC